VVIGSGVVTAPGVVGMVGVVKSVIVVVESLMQQTDTVLFYIREWLYLTFFV